MTDTPVGSMWFADLHRFAEQQGLLRSASLDAIAGRPIVLWPRVIRQHLPWIVAAGLLAISTLGVYLSSRSARQDPLSRFSESPLQTRTVGKLRELQSERALPSSDVTDGDTALADPRGGGLLVTPPRANMQLTDGDRPPAPWTTIIVDPDAPSTAQQSVATLAQALERAGADLSIDTIEVRADRMTVASLTIPRSGLLIRAAEGFAGVLVFETESLPTMDSSVKIDTAGHGISMQGMHLFWDASDVRDGGAVFRVAGHTKEKIMLSGCSVTVNNLPRRSNIVAFHIQNDSARLSDEAAVATNNLLVWFQWKDCIFRGQMSLIGIDVAVRLDVEWTNGLLATSERFLDSGGANSASFAMEQISIKLDRVTTHCDGGFAKIKLGPSGSYPVALTRTSNRCVFIMAPEVPQFEVVGLRGLSLGAPMRLAVDGSDNAYQLDEQRMGVIYRISDIEGETMDFRWVDLDDQDSWFTGYREERPKSTVIWSDVFPPDKPIHSHLPEDYLQDGVLPPGFNPDTIISIPSEIEATRSS